MNTMPRRTGGARLVVAGLLLAALSLPFPSGAGSSEPTASEPPKEIRAGTEGSFRFSNLLQAWGYYDRFEQTDGTKTTFRLRRAELHFKGDAMKDETWEVMIDPAKLLEDQTTKVTVANLSGTPTGSVSLRQPVSAIDMLQDFYMTWASPVGKASVGQFKIPVSWEGFNSSSKLLFPERALSSRAYGDKRDLGVRLDGKAGPIGYWAGIFNGPGLNNLDTDNAKDGALRVEAYPIEGLMLGGVGYTTLDHVRNTPNGKTRLEGDARYEKAGVLVQGEYIGAWDVSQASTGARTLKPGEGWYAAAGYTILGAVQPVVRAGRLCTDQRVPSKGTYEAGAGLNWYLKAHEAKIQAAFVWSQPEADSAKTENQAILAFQVSL